ncbi:MAG: hypothetical protein IPG18_18565 [Saprospiraceae bacterium]|nr:hypothetical protein [Saprospiraceae bacterium]
MNVFSSYNHCCDQYPRQYHRQFFTNTSSGAATTNGIICGINVTAGNFNIGTTTGNTIGATTGVDNIWESSTTSGGAANMIPFRNRNCLYSK